MITMSDIAKKAGVSRSTASGILNNHDSKLRISSETRLRVLEAAKQMGYRRNELARSVAAGKSFVLGYLKQDQLEQESLILEGVLQAASEAGYLVKVIPKGVGEHYGDVVRHCIEHRLAGLVARRFEQNEITDLCQELDIYKIPFIFVDDNVSVPGIGSVTSDDGQGVRLAVDHLCSLGHRNIAFLAGDCSHPQGLLRRQGFLSTMREYGLSVRGNWVRECKWDMSQAEEHTAQIFQDRATLPTALFCDGDHVAAAAMRTLWDIGLRVPEDVSVTGFGNYSYAEMLHPPLTTIMQPFEQMGRVAIGRLLNIISASEENESEGQAIELLPTKLVVRKSTAARRD